MQPIWARKFEPPAIASRESEGVVAALLRIAVYCRDPRYLKPIPSALDYLESSELPGGKLARFYELRTNRPLYMQRKGDSYSLTHDDSGLPSHYGWKVGSRVDHLRNAYESVMAGKELPDPIFPPAQPHPPLEKILSGLDGEGRWISTFSGERLAGQPKFRKGDRYIHSGVFSRNLDILSGAVK